MLPFAVASREMRFYFSEKLSKNEIWTISTFLTQLSSGKKDEERTFKTFSINFKRIFRSLSQILCDQPQWKWVPMLASQILRQIH